MTTAPTDTPPEERPFIVKKVIVVSGNQITNGPVKIGDKVSVILEFTSRAPLQTDQIKDKAEFTLTREQDSFLGKTEALLNITSKPEEPLVFEVMFKDIEYSGVKDELLYKLEWLADTATEPVKQEETLHLKELQPGPKETEATTAPTTTPTTTPPTTEPTTPPTTEPGTTEPTNPQNPTNPTTPPEPTLPEPTETVPVPTVPAPLAQIRRVDEAIFEPGKRGELRYSVENLGVVPIKNPTIRFEPTEGITLDPARQSSLLKDIAPGETAEFTVPFTVKAELKDARQVFATTLTYAYESGGQLQSMSRTEALSVSVKLAAKPANEPVLVLSHDPLPAPLGPSATATLNLHVDNAGSGPAGGVVLALEPGEGLFLTDGQSSHVIGDLPAGTRKSLAVNLKTLAALSGELQTLNVTLRYQYVNDAGTQKETLSEKISLPVKGKGKTDDGSFSSGSSFTSGISAPQVDSAVPNVIIDKYSYGEQTIQAGTPFDLKVEFFNTSEKLKVENIVMTTEPGENFAFNAASNVYYFAAMQPKERQAQTLKMQAQPAAKTGSNTIDISFKYEYVDQGKRTSATLTQKLSIPVVSPDRFHLSQPEVPPTVTAGEEVTLNIAYVNKGKSEVSNVEAVLEGDINALNRRQNLGNFEAGKSGQIAFILKPEKAGTVDLKLTVTYEDQTQKAKTTTFPVKLKVEEGAPQYEEEPLPEFTAETEEPGLTGNLLKFGIPAAALLLIAGLVILIRRRRKTSLKAYDWDDDTTG